MILRLQKLIQYNQYVLIIWNFIILRTRLARVLTCVLYLVFSFNKLCNTCFSISAKLYASLNKFWLRKIRLWKHFSLRNSPREERFRLMVGLFAFENKVPEILVEKNWIVEAFFVEKKGLGWWWACRPGQAVYLLIHGSSDPEWSHQTIDYRVYSIVLWSQQAPDYVSH